MALVIILWLAVILYGIRPLLLIFSMLFAVVTKTKMPTSFAVTMLSMLEHCIILWALLVAATNAKIM